ncbi:lysine--tRNA ligase [Geobacter sulfurreducens]|uniref:Lysine--tRNA ligase n=1 Tax=Geobacter sulfurreducens (strain ATCC 51573 / DSM 12127 / PCA) TaxID=243231 RepID=Q74AT0_GEOSL|nr:lysine--tRNA ligase [Geobacter sulfurreducens]AAR35647.1 lysyl-tRNA synthetase [Geobacter sulfurreducens PCA]ADI85029.1 lysyl-tRNA synthetase [Geobacter sulfurreducens KN400]UAC02985.1 lysine--tRNA ligase [Geobacter sulfurreducens]HCD95034.1 lysine--tRNA ligase [Geobacter sulfurreducens]
MEELSELLLQRRRKVDALWEAGINPYPNDFKPLHTSADFREAYGTVDTIEDDPRSFTVAGRIIARRSFGKAAFIQIQDRKGRMQVYVRKDTVGDEAFEAFETFDIGDIVGVGGTPFRTKTGELTLNAAFIRLLTKSLQPLPEKFHGLTDVETRYRQRYVDLIVNPEVREVFVKRSRIVNLIREFMVRKDFLEVETPMMQPIPGGATARPFVTHHNALDMQLFLRIAPELYLKRLVVGGFERVFEINRNFRNEGISVRHNPEFTMMEFYQAYATFEDLMDFTEELLCHVAQEVLGTLDFTYQEMPISFQRPWKRLAVVEAILEYGDIDAKSLADRDLAYAYAQRLGLDLPADVGYGKLITEIFEEVAETKLIQPTFITAYPTEVSPLSRKSDKDPEIVDRFELFIAGREMANAFSELNDPVDQKERFLAQVAAKAKGDDEAHYMDEDYIRALEFGLPPTAGEGIGIDRLVMLLTDSPSIRDVILFPQLRKEK